MKKIQVEVTRRDSYIIEIDENVYNEKWKEEFEKYFWKVSDHGKMAESLAVFQARNGQYDGGFIEGFGYVKRNGDLPIIMVDEDKRIPAEGLNIVIVDEDDNIEVESKILEE